MINSSSNKEVDRWRKIASNLAIALAVTLLASGVVGGWISFENRTLDAYKSNNEHLRNANKNVTEKLVSTNDERKECKKKNEELEERVVGLEAKLGHLKTEVELFEELDECEKKNEKLEKDIFKLKVSNASLKALLDE